MNVFFQQTPVKNISKKMSWSSLIQWKKEARKDKSNRRCSDNKKTNETEAEGDEVAS